MKGGNEPASGTRKFVVVSAPRTGSTMLATMLNAHPDVICGGEVLNDVWIDQGGPIDWSGKSRHARALEDDPAMHALRRTDPIAFLGRLHELAVDEGYRVVGFKLLYAHGSLRAHVVEYLAGLPDLRVVHLRRRDRLRRLVSLKRAVASGEWVVGQGAGPGGRRRPIRIEWDELVDDFATIAAGEAAVARVFARCPLLDVDYEALESAPGAVAVDVFDFLGVPPRDVEPWTARQGGDAPRDAIENFDELRARARGTEWEPLFDA